MKSILWPSSATDYYFNDYYDDDDDDTEQTVKVSSSVKAMELEFPVPRFKS